MLEAHGLHFWYGTRKIVDNLDLDVRPGELLCLLGPNGAGKSSLLRLMAGIVRPGSGHVRAGGRDLQECRARERARQIAFVPQDNPACELLVRQYLMLGRIPHLRWRPSQRDGELVDLALAQLGIAELAERRIAQLSGGERQKAAIARALAQQSPCLVLDEPTASLDMGAAEDILGRLRDLAQREQRAVLVAIHDLALALRHADRCALMANGSILQTAVPHELDVALLRRMYGLERLELLRHGTHLVPVCA